MRVAITGANGRLATALRPYFPTADWLSRDSLDCSNQGAVRKWFAQHPADLILHLAAETRHDADPRSYVHNNICATGYVACEAIRLGARLVYPSTDYVYPGINGLYKEYEPLSPVGSYAASKLAGEVAARVVSNHLVIRGSWYSTLDWTQAAINCWTSKIPVTTAAGWIAQLSTSTHTGVMNVGGCRRSLYEIVAGEFRPNTKPVTRDKMDILTYQLPQDTSLDTTKMRRALGIAR